MGIKRLTKPIDGDAEQAPKKSGIAPDKKESPTPVKESAPIIESEPDFVPEEPPEESPLYESTPQETARAESRSEFKDAADFYLNLMKPLPDTVHWLARQVRAEALVVLMGYSLKTKFWNDERSRALVAMPFGLEGEDFILSWQIPSDDIEAHLMLQDMREHMKWVFGESFVVRPVSELSEAAKAWDFKFNG